MKPTLWLLLSLAFFSACKKNSDPGNRLITADQEKIVVDVAYGTDVKQKIDIYLPAARNNRDTKLLIMVHGGGWVEGDKADMANFVAGLRQRLPDFAIANVNYRLSSGVQNTFPAQEQDIRQAVAFLLSSGDNYVFAQKYVMLGASSGGHLALLQAYKYGSAKLKGAISFYGPTDLTALYNSSGAPAAIAATLGGTPSSNASIYEQSSPITYVNGGTCPTLLLHGQLDVVVPVAQSTMLDNKLASFHVVHQLVLYPNGGHGWVGDDLTDSFNRVAGFLNTNVN